MNFRQIPTHESFVDALAAWLLARHAEGPLALAGTLVLLPSRRSCRSLREAFLRQSDGRPLLLPRILPIGEVEGEADLLALDGSTPPAPAMSDKERLSILTRLIRQGEQSTPARAYQLAVELARLLDDVARHDLDFGRLERLAPLELAAHWQKTTDFLRLVTRQWPHILEAEGKRDAADITRERLGLLAARWRESPPDFPVVAAGSTGSIPTTADLLLAVAAMPQGTVILPGLDSAISDEAWELLDPTHPHYLLKKLLEKAGVERTIPPLIQPASSGREGLRALFAPAPLTAHWRQQEMKLADDFAHLSLMEADTQIDEARMIAYRLRAALETPGKTAALVTPDRILARMVAAECARYGITIDDSAGTPLADSPTGIFLQLLLEAVDSGMAPGALLALLRHPFASVGIGPAQCREISRILEKDHLRGVRLSGGMDALADAVRSKRGDDGIAAFTTRLRDLLRPLEMAYIARSEMSLPDLIALHCSVAEALADTDERSGADILWSHESGAQMAAVLAEWRGESERMGMLAPQDYLPLLGAMLAGEAVRKPYGSHPRLHILSPIEARLTHYDLVILGEMNEGTWPATVTVDPWMSGEMREAFGLPPHALSIGQSAHDIWMLMHAPQVILTRARKIFGAPQKASRWWVRLVTLAEGKDPLLLARMNQTAAMQATLAAQDAPYDLRAHEKPQPKPPRAARPTRFRATEIDLWCDEPYAFYARRILSLRPLDPLDQEPDAIDFGNSIHAAFEHFSAEFPDHLPEHAYQRLLAHGERLLAPYIHQPSVGALWWPRFEAIARHWIAREKLLRAEPYTTQSEVSAAWDFDVAGETVTLKARADRVDRMPGGFRLIDYKTGAPPTAKKVTSGEAKQLPLTALALIRSGAIEASPQALVYWALRTRESSKDIVEITDAAILLEQTGRDLFAMIEASLTGHTHYAPATVSKLPDYRDEYDHLIRRAEWGTG